MTGAQVSAGPTEDPMDLDPAGQDEPLDQVLGAWMFQEGQGEGENRQEAATRITAWMAVGNVESPLDLSSLRLTSLPAPLPTGLQELDASHNQLTRLPAPLPEGLQILNVSHNQLTSFQDAPEGLQELDVSANQLTSLLGAPEGLQALDVSFNQLRSFQDAPEGLEELYASHNQITSLTADPHTLASVIIDLEGNPLLEQVRTNLLAMRNAEDYGGPRVILAADDDDEEEEDEERPARPLGEAVADWLGDASEAAVWQGFAEEEGAPEYARFLDALKNSAAYSARDFRQAVATELTELSDRPQRRQKCFLLAFGATETCVDRPLEVWHEMYDIGLWADVMEGVYDGKVHELIPLARQSFRMKVLSEIAAEKVRSLRFVRPVDDDDVDEVEVHLAYPVELRKRLRLSHAVPAMQFFRVASVTSADLDAAEARVRAEEATGFTDHLSQWEPWEALVSRIAPEAYEAMEKRLREAMVGKETDEDETVTKFQSRLAQRLADDGLTGIPDAERELGAQVRDELAREIKGDLMRQVLRDKDLEALLDPPAP